MPTALRWSTWLLVNYPALSMNPFSFTGISSQRERYAQVPDYHFNGIWRFFTVKFAELNMDWVTKRPAVRNATAY